MYQSEIDYVGGGEQTPIDVDLERISAQLSIIHPNLKEAQNTLTGQRSNLIERTKNTLSEFINHWPSYKDKIKSCKKTHQGHNSLREIATFLDEFYEALKIAKNSLGSAANRNRKIQEAIVGFEESWPLCKTRIQNLLMSDNGKVVKDETAHTRGHAGPTHGQAASVTDQYHGRGGMPGMDRSGAVNKAGMTENSWGPALSDGGDFKQLTASPPGIRKEAQGGYAARGQGGHAAVEMMKVQEERNLLKRLVESLEKKNADLVRSMSEMMNTRISADERNFENVSDPCRPSAVCEQYANFCSYQWLDAKTALDGRGYREDDSCRILCDILVEASKFSKDEAYRAYSGIRATLDSVQTGGQRGSGVSQPGDMPSMPEDLTVAVSKYFKMRLEKKDLAGIKQNVKAQVSQNIRLDRKIWDDPQIQRYLHDGVVIAWKMALQLPMMSLSAEGSTYTPEQHELAINSQAPGPRVKIAYYVHPVVLHRDRVVARGKVFLR